MRIRQQPPQSAMRARLHTASPYFPLFYIWGVQWIFLGVIGFIYIWNPSDWIRSGSSVLAALLSIGVIIRAARQPGSVSPSEQPESPKTFRMSSGPIPLSYLLLPIAALLLSILLLVYVGTGTPFFIELLRSSLLSLVYMSLGVMLGRTLTYLGIWLLALTGFIGIWFLGFAPMVLGLFGGLSLIVCGWILSMWKRNSRRP